MAISSRNKVSAQFSMSGMSDIIFLLLIFFMLTSTLIAPNAIKLLLPQSSNQTQASPQVSLSITKEIDFYLGAEKLPFNQIEARLQKELKFRVEPTVSVHADKSVPVEYIVKVMNIAKRNKYRIILATAPE